MHLVTPQIYLLASTEMALEMSPDIESEVKGFNCYLEDIGVSDWESDAPSDAEELLEIAGRVCYKSFAVGLNPNVTKVRDGNEEYLANIVKSRHGAVAEHASISFLFHNVSRVFTHELVRHRIGVGISQESMRYVRLTDLPFWFPEWALENEELMERCKIVLEIVEAHQEWMTKEFGLDDPGCKFHEKKAKTSFMRRFAPMGVGTSIVWSANLRALRHIIELRTSEAAEEEIRLVYDEVAKYVVQAYPNLFADFTRKDNGEWIPTYSKI